MKVKLDDVIDALEFVNSGIDSSAYYNDKRNEFIYISEYSDMNVKIFTIIVSNYLQNIILMSMK